jgi:hypothetical protein
MKYHIKVSRAGTLLEEVIIEAASVLAAIEMLDAEREKFTVQYSYGPDHVVTAHWSGFEYEVREMPSRAYR